MNRWIPAALILLVACGRQVPTTPVDPADEGQSDEPGSDEPGSDEPGSDEPGSRAQDEPDPAIEPAVPWLRELLAFDLLAMPTDARTIALGERLRAPVTCPQPGTGCYVELPLAGASTQVHIGDDRAIQVWGPTEPFQMVPWVAGVEDDIDRSSLEAVNEPGTRPDRLWRDAQHVVLLHDHSTQPCGGFCPSMIWIAPPDHPAARGYGFGAGAGSESESAP